MLVDTEAHVLVCVGCVYAERVDHETDGLDEEADATHECIEQFDEFTVWKHDSAPDTKTDPFFVAMEWSNISSHVRSGPKF